MLPAWLLASEARLHGCELWWQEQSAAKSASYSIAREEEEEIVLVHSNSPRVLEEDKDLVILDEVEPEPAPILPLPLPVAHQAPKTPRVHIQREMQMEEEQEAEEVEETIAAIAEADEGGDDGDDVQEVPPPSEQPRPQVTGWRKSIDMVRGSLGWAFRGLSVEPKQEEEDAVLEHADEQEEGFDEEGDNYMDEQAEEAEYPDEFEENYDEQQTPEHDGPHDYEDEPEPPRPLGRFMTPRSSARRPPAERPACLLVQARTRAPNACASSRPGK
ncbi:hypothetical protein NUW54_g8562 [Trametes sanguinea]|uniref:Uncharacterized protein n=1 Tax=Trametes sanguinea TaxID=158606 RepID=A0ACC1PCG7_9APHY|nr:hypothetical protein NUW54_g8562 [Trametes sanguinea]